MYQQIQDDKVLQRIKDLDQDIAIAKAKKDAGIEGQDELIEYLKKARQQILNENKVKTDG